MGYQAWLHDVLMGEGATEEEAIEAAVAEYEKVAYYSDSAPHLFTDRGELVTALGISPKED